MEDMTAEQLRAARALIRWSQADLAKASGVSAPTVKRLEGMDGPLRANGPTIQALALALGKAGVALVPENGGGAGVRLAKSRD